MDRFGINIKRYCRDHEREMRGTPPTAALYALHLEKLRWIQHERLIHLIVTVFVSFVELFILDLVLLHSDLGLMPPVLLLLFAVLLGFYFTHYFFLENTVQRWYKIADGMREALHQSETSRSSATST